MIGAPQPPPSESATHTMQVAQAARGEKSRRSPLLTMIGAAVAAVTAAGGGTLFLATGAQQVATPAAGVAGSTSADPTATATAGLGATQVLPGLSLSVYEFAVLAAIVMGVVAGIIAIFWLFVGSKDQHLQSKDEQIALLTASMHDARTSSEGMSKQLVEVLGGIAKTSEVALGRSAASVEASTAAVAEMTRANQVSAMREEREHALQLSSLERVVEELRSSRELGREQFRSLAGEITSLLREDRTAFFGEMRELLDSDRRERAAIFAQERQALAQDRQTAFAAVTARGSAA